MRFSLLLLLLFVGSNTALFAQKEGFEFVNPPMTIVVLGSSTAEGIGTWPRDSAWVNRFRVYVKQFNPENEVINLGKGGFSTYNILPTPDESIRNRPYPDSTRNFTKALEYKPDGIIINLPSNDVASGYSMEEQLDNFRKFAQIAEENNIELWVCTTQARNFPKARDRQEQRDLVDSLQSMFHNYSIDFWSDFGDDDYRILKQYDSGDGCHMNNGAHKILLERVIEAQAFAGRLDASSFQRSTLKPKTQKSPFALKVGFDGEISIDTTHRSAYQFVKVRQQYQQKGAVKVSEDLSYNIETLMDTRMNMDLIFEFENGLTKIVEFDFTEIQPEMIAEFPKVYYPIEALDMNEVSLKTMNYNFPNNEFIVARFQYDTLTEAVSLDMNFVKEQHQRLEDACLKGPSKGNKRVLRWENGEKKAVLKFKNGSLHGKSKWYTESGKKDRFVQFSIGKYHGKYIEFDEEGKKKTLRVFRDDRQQGATVTFE